MPLSELRHLIAEAVALGGGNLCASGHEWVEDGVRVCPNGRFGCWVAVHRCARCGKRTDEEVGFMERHFSKACCFR